MKSGFIYNTAASSASNVLQEIETPPLISIWLQVGCEQCVMEDAEACKAAVNTVQPIDLHTYPKVESEWCHNQTFSTYFTGQHINIRPNVKFCYDIKKHYEWSRQTEEV